MSKAQEAARTAAAPKPETEERAFPPLAARLLAELLARQQREIDDTLGEIAAAAGVRIADGWHVDVQGGRFVRQVPGEG